MTKIPLTKPSRIAVGAHNKFKLEPAVERTHYGEHRTLSGGQPYAFSAKRADDAWFVLGEWSGDKLGVLQKWSDGEWSFSKIGPKQETPRWLRSQYGDMPATFYNVDKHLRTGSTPEEALAEGLGIKLPPPPPRGMTKKKAAQLERDIAESLARYRG